MRFPLGQPITTVGRGAQNDLCIPDSPTVSIRHLEIRNDGREYKLYDLDSTNGTFLDGQRVLEAALKPSCNIQLGDGGPELTFLVEKLPQVNVDQTIDSRRDSGAPTTRAEDRTSRAHDDLLIEALAKSSLGRERGIGDQTLMIMRQTLHKVVHRTRRKFLPVLVALILSLLGVSAFGIWRIRSLKAERNRIDGAIRSIEARLQETNPNQPEASALYESLNDYEGRARSLERGLLYRVTVRTPVDPLEQEIKGLLAEFGAETYTVPSEFLEQTKRFIERYQGPDRPNVEHGLGEARKQIDTVRSIFEEEHLPPDLAFMSIVERPLDTDNRSRAGAVGLWQFT